MQEELSLPGDAWLGLSLGDLGGGLEFWWISLDLPSHALLRTWLSSGSWLNSKLPTMPMAMPIIFRRNRRSTRTVVGRELMVSSLFRSRLRAIALATRPKGGDA